jgi:hypothetical protein
MLRQALQAREFELYAAGRGGSASPAALGADHPEYYATFFLDPGYLTTSN